MKNILAFTVVLAITVFAQAASSPTPPWFEAIAPNVFLADATSDQEGHFVKKVARVIFDVSTDITGTAAETANLGVVLPQGAVITRSYFKIITPFTDSGSTTVALTCEDAGNIYAASDFTGADASANAFFEGASTGTAATFQRAIGAECAVSAVVTGSANNYLTAGKLVGWIEYVLENR